MGKARNLDIDRDADMWNAPSALSAKVILREKLAEVAAEQTIILVQSRFRADCVTIYLATIDLPVNNIHEERQVEEMEKVLVEFRSGDKPILVVTPAALTHDLVLALGTRDVAHIIDFDMLEDIDKLLLLIGYWDNPGKLTFFVEPTVALRMPGM